MGTWQHPAKLSTGTEDIPVPSPTCAFVCVTRDKHKDFLAAVLKHPNVQTAEWINWTYSYHGILHSNEKEWLPFHKIM